MIVKKKTDKVKSATNTCGIPAKPSVSEVERPSVVKSSCGKRRTARKVKSSSCSTPKKPTEAQPKKQTVGRVESVATLRGSRRNSYDKAESHIRSAIDILCSSEIADAKTKEIVADLAVVLMDIQSK